MQTENQRLKIVREDLGYNQTKFSDILGVKQSYLSALEAGKKEITAKVLKVLLVKFNISPAWILAQEGDKFSEKSPLLLTENKIETFKVSDNKITVQMFEKEITFIFASQAKV